MKPSFKACSHCHTTCKAFFVLVPVFVAMDTIEPANVRDYTKPTPFHCHFKKMKDLTPVLAAYERTHKIEDALKNIPEDVFMLRGLIPQLEACKGKKVMLVMGFCKMPGRDITFSGDGDDLPMTERIVRSLEMGGANPVLLIDMRNECRREKDRDRCKSIKKEELDMLLASKAVELRIALHAFNIEVRSVLTFSACWTER